MARPVRAMATVHHLAESAWRDSTAPAPPGIIVGQPPDEPGLENPVSETLGFIAAACTTFAFVPQALRVWHTHSAKDISLSMYVVMAVGVTLWIAYGIRIHSQPLVVANAVSLLLTATVLAGKLRYGVRPR